MRINPVFPKQNFKAIVRYDFINVYKNDGTEKARKLFGNLKNQNESIWDSDRQKFQDSIEVRMDTSDEDKGIYHIYAVDGPDLDSFHRHEAATSDVLFWQPDKFKDAYFNGPNVTKIVLDCSDML